MVARMREEIPIPEGVKVELRDKTLYVKGPKGEISRDFSYARGIIISVDGSRITLETSFANRRKKATFYTLVAHIRNAFTGVQKGFRYSLKVVYSHFPVSVKVVGDELQITNLIGEKTVRRAKKLKGVKVTVKGEDVIVEGVDVEAVGQTAANIEAAAKIKGFDRRVFMDGVFLYEKGVMS